MQRANYKIRKSLNKHIQKQNNAQALNNHTKSLYPSKKNLNQSIPTMTIRLNNPQTSQNNNINPKILVNKKTVNLEPVKPQFRISFSGITNNLKFCSPKQLIAIQYQINQLENINLISTYSNDLFKLFMHLKDEKIQFLKNHQITPSLRVRMIDWMTEVLGSFKCSDLSYFRSVLIMDKYLSKVQKSKKTSELHLIGVVSMFLACKLQQIYPLKIKTVYQKITHKKISIQEIQKTECQFLEVFQFMLNNPTILDCSMLILHTVKLAKVCKKQFEQIQKILLYTSKITLYDYSILSKYKYSTISTAIVILTFRLFCQKQNGIFSIQQNSNKVFELVSQIEGLQTIQLIQQCIQKIGKLLKNFDKLYPSLVNFKKFNKIQQLQDKIGDKYCTL